jgi:phospholipid transport system substrate-binding protein
MTNLYSTGKVRRTEHEIEDIIKHRVDYEEMARRVPGTSWFTLSHRDQHEFVDLFVQLLQDTFVGRVTELSDEQMVFLGGIGRTSLL